MTPQQSDAEVKSDDKTLATVTSGQPHLAKQDLATLDITKLTPLSPQVISRQATINIGTIGHVAHGKSTVVKALSGVHTVRFKNELERNITIKLGYANAKVYRCDDPKCQRPTCYTSMGSSKEDSFILNGFRYNLVRHVSFVDCPGHDILMATMLNGAAVMDAALLLIGNYYKNSPRTSSNDVIHISKRFLTSQRRMFLFKLLYRKTCVL